MEGHVGDKVGCNGTGGEKDWPGVVEHEVNDGGVEREGSLVDEGSSGEEEGYGWGFVVDKELGEVREGGQRISWVRLRRRETVEGGGKKGLDGSKGSENHYGWEVYFAMDQIRF